MRNAGCRYRTEDPGCRWSRLWLAILSCAAAAGAAQPSISARLSADSCTVGDRLHYHINVAGTADIKVIPPDPQTGFGGFTVREWTSNRRESPAGDTVSFTYILTTYRAEPDTIPALVFVAVSRENTDTLTTPAQPVRVYSVLTGDTVDIRDLKHQQRAGTPSRWWLWLSMWVLGLSALGYIVWYLVQRLKKEPAPPPPKPPLEEALDLLRALRARQFAEKGQIREFVFGLSHILKRYMGRRFSVRTEEYTTEEMLGWLPRAPLPDEERHRAQWFFENTHMVKFAKYVPPVETLRRFDTEVERFVMNTRPSVMRSDEVP